MYSWLFRRLPGPLWLRIIFSIGILTAILFLLVTFTFPWMSEVAQFTESTVGITIFTVPTI